MEEKSLMPQGAARTQQSIKLKNSKLQQVAAFCAGCFAVLLFVHFNHGMLLSMSWDDPLVLTWYIMEGTCSISYLLVTWLQHFYGYRCRKDWNWFDYTAVTVMSINAVATIPFMVVSAVLEQVTLPMLYVAMIVVFGVVHGAIWVKLVTCCVHDRRAWRESRVTTGVKWTFKEYAQAHRDLVAEAEMDASEQS